MDGNTRELAVIRVPSEAEEQPACFTATRTAGSSSPEARAQGRSLLVNHICPRRPLVEDQTWSRLSKLLPGWICVRWKFTGRLAALEQQIGVLSAQLEAAAPADVPAGVGKLTTVMMTREICVWERFTNRRAISSYTGLCPGEHTSGSKRVPGSVTKRGNPRLRAALVDVPGAWCASSPTIRR